MTKYQKRQFQPYGDDYKWPRRCVLCYRHIDTKAGEGLHFPCYWGCEEPLRTIRKERPNHPVCVDCLPEKFKRGGPGWKPILHADDLPKVGDRVNHETMMVVGGSDE